MCWVLQVMGQEEYDVYQDEVVEYVVEICQVVQQFGQQCQDDSVGDWIYQFVDVVEDGYGQDFDVVVEVVFVGVDKEGQMGVECVGQVCQCGVQYEGQYFVCVDVDVYQVGGCFVEFDGFEGLVYFGVVQ